MSNEHNNAPVPEWDNKAYMTAIAGLRVKYGISHAMADLYYESWVELVRHSQKLEEQIARMNEHNNAPAVPQGEPVNELVRLCPDIECARKKKCTRIPSISCMSRAKENY